MPRLQNSGDMSKPAPSLASLGITSRLTLAVLSPCNTHLPVQAGFAALLLSSFLGQRLAAVTLVFGINDAMSEMVGGILK